MNYDREILRVLVEAGSEGLSVQKISRHVHYACNSFFNVIDFDELHRYVAQFLLRNSKNPESLIEKTDRGVYHLNMKNTNPAADAGIQRNTNRRSTGSFDKRPFAWII